MPDTDLSLDGIAPDCPAGAPATFVVVIPHYNDVTRLCRCLAALSSQDRSGVEVVVVDNASTDSLDPARAVAPWARFLTEPQKGAGLARNLGVTETQAPFIAFLDSDCLPAPDWIAQARATAVRTDGDIFGGRIDVFDETPPPRSGAEAFEAVFAFPWRSYIEKKNFSVTANLVTRREVFDRTGPLRTGVTEDIDWCHRAIACGFRLRAAPDLIVGHPSRPDWDALRRKTRRITQENWLLEGQRAPVRWAVRGLAMPLSIFAHLPRLLTSPALRGPGERLRASGTLVRIRLLRMVWMLRQAAGGSL